MANKIAFLKNLAKLTGYDIADISYEEFKNMVELFPDSNISVSYSEYLEVMRG